MQKKKPGFIFIYNQYLKIKHLSFIVKNPDAFSIVLTNNWSKNGQV
jgi:hypothetical protein